MAKVKLYEALGDYAWIPDLYDTKTLGIDTKSSTKLVLDDKNGASITIIGTGFKYSSGSPTAGTVDAVEFRNSAGKLVITYTDADYALKGLFAEASKDNLFDLFSFLNKGDDTITGTKLGDDILPGQNFGDDTVSGGAGDDFVKGGAGSKNSYDGGTSVDDYDTLTYQEAYWDKDNVVGGVTLNAATGKSTNPWGGHDTFKNFEDMRGSYKVDKLTGSSKDETFVGFAGADIIDGAGGRDRARYDQDDQFGGKKGIVANMATGTVKDGYGDTDTIKNIERIVGSNHADTFLGGSKDDWFRGLDGVDSFDGKAGTDKLSFYGTEHGVKINLALSGGEIIDDGYGNKETAKSIENIDASAFADTLTGDSGSNGLWGDDGNDKLNGGKGQDWLGGGNGDDRFIFSTAADSTLSNSDFIDDFTKGSDLIDIRNVLDHDLVFRGKSGFTDHAGEVRYGFLNDGNTFIQADVDGDGDADFQVVLQGKIAIAASDFVIG